MDSDPEIPTARDVSDSPPDSADAARLEAEAKKQKQDRIIARVAASQLDDTQDRVAWILNRYPDTRDSDRELALSYWYHFEDAAEDAPLSELRRLTPFTSLVRQRAKIQNNLQLFQASEPVRANRGVLSEEERENQRAPRRDAHPSVTIFMDETGKTGAYLIAGGLWAINPYNVQILAREIRLWKQSRGLKKIHFTEMTREEVGAYNDLVDLLVTKLSTFGFKFVAVERRMAPPNALSLLYYQLVAAGLEHDDRSGRCRLPRTVEVWKDEDDPTVDALLMAELRDRLQAVAPVRFSNRLAVGNVQAVPSHSNELLQVADLFLGSINRVLNGTGATGAHYKDVFARRALDAFSIDPTHDGQIEDLACRLHL